MQLLLSFKWLFFTTCLVTLLCSACQQQVSETTSYDLDAQSISEQTRALEHKYIYKAPDWFDQNPNTSLAEGNLTAIHLGGEHTLPAFTIEEVTGELQEFQVQKNILERLNTGMYVHIRYMEDDKGKKILEIY